MAITDIDFSEGDIQDFLVEIPLGSLNAPVDIMGESASDRYLVTEIALPSGSGDGDIFIIND
jgi:hypothetical protein